MKNKGLGCLVVLLVFILLVSMGVNFLQFASAAGLGGSTPGFVMPKEKFSEKLEKEGEFNTKDKIVQLDLDGIITSSSEDGMFGSAGLTPGAVRRALDQAVADVSVKAIVLKVNTPGGEVTASDTIYHAVKEAAKVKPVVVYMDSMATSGGYYLSCGATRVVANETTLTGSIGVIIQTLNYSQAFGKVGLESLTFVSGNFKDSLSGSRPMRDDEKAYVQNLVMQMYDKFVGIVAEARKVDVNVLKSTVADGRVVTGKEALESKLVDELGYIEDAYRVAKELGQAPDAMVVRYESSPSFLQIFGGLGSAQARGQSNTITLDVSERLLPRLEAGRMYLLPSHMAP
ncbi:signal peptide peptidase SppA [Phragmitibacter flavus]|uniref:Signal peptide peptidase SppA n=1 Tax=Phragmitibacter flavus TaxID=2576071 RepID=A0A5R8KJY1_9BACT|nr:signal peptide peptidase SppA [Phragmitibacter flavus]TLD71919.1 signal peptide peptidase SppA [Phragmitibacter flavus]